MAKRKRTWVWLRVGDMADYEHFNDVVAAATAFAAGFAPRGGRELRRRLEWRSRGFEIGPHLAGRNYVSLYWGDADADFVRDLDASERTVFQEMFLRSVGPSGPKEWTPGTRPEIGAARKRRGKEWSPRGGRPPSYTRENLPPVDEDLAVCEEPGELRVSIAWIGEGLQEDFNPDDPGDIPVLRFTVDDLRFPPDEHGWRSRSYQDNSFATQMPATLPLSVMKSVCEAIARTVSGEESWKRRLEEWSWVDEKDARRIHAEREKDA